MMLHEHHWEHDHQQQSKVVESVSPLFCAWIEQRMGRVGGKNQIFSNLNYITISTSSLKDEIFKFTHSFFIPKWLLQHHLEPFPLLLRLVRHTQRTNDRTILICRDSCASRRAAIVIIESRLVAAWVWVVVSILFVISFIIIVIIMLIIIVMIMLPMIAARVVLMLLMLLAINFTARRDVGAVGTLSYGRQMWLWVFTVVSHEVCVEHDNS